MDVVVKGGVKAISIPGNLTLAWHHCTPRDEYPAADRRWEMQEALEEITIPQQMRKVR